MLNSPRRLLVLDDDPTGSQCVHGVSVAFEEDPRIIVDALHDPGSTCFVLTNTRALDRDEAVAKNRRILEGVLEVADDRGLPLESLHVISRSDSTLRGHVLDEPAVIAEVLAGHGIKVDGYLFCPAMLEAGRYTQGDIHYAVVQGEAVEVGDTDFAQDATFGYSSSDLKDFLVEKSQGKLNIEDIISISLEDIREGGVKRVAQILETVTDGQWVVLNCTEYQDLEVVTDAVTIAEDQGMTFVTRSGPSFVRPLAGQHGAKVLASEDITPADSASHGLVVVGSHVGLTNRQLKVLQEHGSHREFELDVAQILDPSTRDAYLPQFIGAVGAELKNQDCVIYTSRTLVRTEDPAESLRIAGQVSDAVVEIVQKLRNSRPAWVVAKGGITSHEVAHKGLGIRLGTVAGQFYPGQISLFQPIECPDEVRDIPYVVFPGNVGGEHALAEVVERLRTAR